jgi:hypothetical protein
VSRINTTLAPVPSTGPQSSEVIASDEHVALSKLYVLTEKLIVTKTTELVLKAMDAPSKEKSFKQCYHYPALNLVQIIYNGTPVKSLARR